MTFLSCRAIDSFVQSVKYTSKLEASEVALKKQAGNVSAEYMKVLNAGNPPKQDSPKSAPTSSSAATEKSLEAIKKQAENQQVQYEKLLEENRSLKNRLADYDL